MISPSKGAAEAAPERERRMAGSGYEKGSGTSVGADDTDVGGEKGNASPCSICGEPRGDETPCPHCGMED